MFRRVDRRMDRRLEGIVPLGALDDDPGMKAADYIFVASKCEWHDLPPLQKLSADGRALRT